tara:strand:- start:197 stop:727 length:531 start_codon:yes stop_codon:yes gene_type:complete
LKNNSLDIRIVADTQKDIFADLRIIKGNNFLIIHDFLVENFHLDKLEMSSFFYSNDDWDKGEEITLMNMNIGDDQTVKFMESISLNEVFEKEKLKFLYVNDFLNMNIFYVEILKESDLENDETLKLLHKLGEYEAKKSDDTLNTEDENKLSEIEDILNEPEEDDFGGFEELDQDLY